MIIVILTLSLYPSGDLMFAAVKHPRRIGLQIAQNNNNRGHGGLQGGQPSPAKLLMQLVAAPSIFSVPLCTGRLLTPPFRVWPLADPASDTSMQTCGFEMLDNTVCCPCATSCCL